MLASYPLEQSDTKKKQKTKKKNKKKRQKDKKTKKKKMDLSSFVHVRRSGLLAAIISTSEINAIKMAEELPIKEKFKILF